MTKIKMKTLGAFMIAGLVLPAASALAAQSYDSHALVLKNVTGTVHVRTAKVAAISVDIDDGAGVIDAPKVSLRGGVVLVRGEKYRHVNCTVRNHKVRLSVARFGIGKKHALADFPKITVTMPEGSSLKITGGRVFGEAGDVAQANVQINGCGNFTLGAIAGDLDTQINGSGDFITGAVGGKADVQLNGSGDMTIADVSGEADAQVNGSGDLNLGAVNSSLDAQINGSGNIHVASVNGSVDAGINGSGDIVIKGGTATPFHASIIGSGDVAFHGHANGVDARVTGSGDITMASYEGEFHTSKHGVHVTDE